MRTLSYFLALLGFAGLVGGGPAGEVSVAPPPRPIVSDPELDELIRQLGSDDFATRGAAKKALLKRPDAERQLKAAAKSDNAEVRDRVATILKHHEGQHLLLQFKRIEKIAAAGHYDLLVECCSMWGIKPGGERA